MARIPNNYLGPKERILLLKRDYPGIASSIKTLVKCISTENFVGILVKATIEVDEKILAQGHAFTSTPNDEKEVEKAETVAIGRALINAGYPETSDEEEEAVVKDKPRGIGLKTGGSKNEEVSRKSKSSIRETNSEAEEGVRGQLGRGSISGLGGRGGDVRNSLGASVRSSIKAEEEKVEVSEEGKEESKSNIEKEAIAETKEQKAQPEESLQAVKPRMTKEELLAKYKAK